MIGPRTIQLMIAVPEKQLSERPLTDADCNDGADQPAANSGQEIAGVPLREGSGRLHPLTEKPTAEQQGDDHTRPRTGRARPWVHVGTMPRPATLAQALTREQTVRTSGRQVAWPGRSGGGTGRSRHLRRLPTRPAAVAHSTSAGQRGVMSRLPAAVQHWARPHIPKGDAEQVGGDLVPTVWSRHLFLNNPRSGVGNASTGSGTTTMMPHGNGWRRYLARGAAAGSSAAGAARATRSIDKGRWSPSCTDSFKRVRIGTDEDAGPSRSQRSGLP